MTTSRYEMDLMLDIAKRAADEFSNIKRPLSYWVMDIENAHTNMPLRLHELLAADRMNFAHDVLGIFDHLDRSSGKLMDCFVPRFAIQ